MAGLLLSIFRGMGVRLSVVAGGRDPGLSGVEFHRCKPFALGRIWRTAAFARSAGRLAAGLAADLIVSQEHIPVCHVYRAGGGARAEWFRQRHRARGFWGRLWDRIDPYPRVKLRLERALYRSPDLRAVICNSPMVRDDIRRHYGVPVGKLHVIENAIDTAAYRPPADVAAVRWALRAGLGLPADGLLFLFVGAGFERKGLGAAIRALAVSGLDAHLAVIGRDRRRRHYGRLARRLGVADRMTFLGRRDDVPRFYWAADGLLHPALYEAFGLVVLEAMAAGLPVVSSHQCGAAGSLIRPGENGFVHDALDIDGLAGSLRRFADAAWRERAGRSAMAAAAVHTPDRLRGELETLCRGLLDGRGLAHAGAHDD